MSTSRHDQTDLIRYLFHLAKALVRLSWRERTVSNRVGPLDEADRGCEMTTMTTTWKSTRYLTERADVRVCLEETLNMEAKD